MENSVLNRTVSKFNHFSGVAFDYQLLDHLNDDTYKWEIKKIRSLATKEERDVHKAKLPCISPSAVINGTRSDANIVAHTGLISFDIDKLSPENLEEVKDVIIKMPYVAYCGLSSGGAGFWGLVPISNRAKHLQHFNALQYYFLENGIDRPYFDRVVKDVSRLRFYSWDPDAYFNHCAKTFDYTYEPPPVVKKPYDPTAHSTENNPFDDFNLNGNIPALLLAHGWTHQPAFDKGTRTRYTRPGKERGISADYCSDRRLLYVFSDAPETGLSDAGKAFNHVQVFKELECGNDIKVCARKLKELGFGVSN